MWNRVSYDDDRFVKSIDPVIRTFDTSAGELRVKVIPVPGNTNGNGKRGAHMGIAVSVSWDGVTVERRKGSLVTATAGRYSCFHCPESLDDFGPTACFPLSSFCSCITKVLMSATARNRRMATAARFHG